jgi:hypothetical protein
VRGPVLLAVEIKHASGQIRQPQLQLPQTTSGPRSIPLQQVDAEEDLYVGRVEASDATLGQPVPYYFSTLTPEGDEAVSELFEFVPVAEAADLSRTGKEPAVAASLP